jgi:hypothetical protein
MRAISSLLLALTILGGNGCNNPDKDWKDAEAKNTIAAYERFLSNHPGHAKAKVAIARIDWGKAKQKNTIEAYETFVSKHPNDVNAIEASSRLEELNRPLDWQKAKSEGSINAYQEFLTKHPNGDYSEIAKRELSKLLLPIEFNKAISLNTIDGYINFLAQYPGGKEVAKIKTNLEPMLYNQAIKSDDLAAYRNYEKYFSSSSRINVLHSKYQTLLNASEMEYFVSEIETKERSKADYNIIETFDYEFDVNEEYLKPANTSKAHLLWKIKNSSKTPIDVYYWVKTNQILMSHLANIIISNKIFFEYWNKGGDINSLIEQYCQKRLGSIKMETLSIEQRSKIWVSATEDIKNDRSSQYNRAIELFNERLSSFAALLPVVELSKYDYTPDTYSKKGGISLGQKGISINLFLEASKLLESLNPGDKSKGVLLFESIGNIKIAYLGVMIINIDYSKDQKAKKKIDVLLYDTKAYYNFLEMYYSSSKTSIMRDNYKNKKGIFGEEVFEMLEKSLSSGSGISDFAKLLTPSNK